MKRAQKNRLTSSSLKNNVPLMASLLERLGIRIHITKGLIFSETGRESLEREFKPFFEDGRIVALTSRIFNGMIMCHKLEDIFHVSARNPNVQGIDEAWSIPRDLWVSLRPELEKCGAKLIEPHLEAPPPDRGVETSIA